jgi:hypothetical protein
VPDLTFSAQSHAELVIQVRQWLETAESVETTPATIVGKSAEITKDALRVVADAAPKPIGESELVKALTEMGYVVTDRTRDTVIAGLGVATEVTDGSFVRRVQSSGESALFEMNATFAKKLLSRLVRE